MPECNVNKPNLFQVATSELTQDALIVWLLQWADKKFSKIDPDLNLCAVNFVRKLLKIDDYIVDSIEAGRQWNNIDVWALINNEYFIVIEDKKGTKEHSDQLRRYAERAREHYKNTKIKIVLIYFKMEEQGEYTEIEKNGYSLLSRERMLSILKNYMKSKNEKLNDIMVDFYCYLKNLDSQINSYKTLPIKDWHWYSWTGFFSRIQNDIGGNWDYVPNASGGFLGFWWHWHHFEKNGIEFEIYLQLEYDRLVFKLYCNNPDNRKNVRELYRKALYGLAEQKNINVQQFGRLGQWMGVAKLSEDYRVTGDSGIIDIKSTVVNLREIEKLLDLVASDLKKQIP